ncbi:MAG TPA: RNA-binding protein [Oscillatoriales bacterium UBA8482]|nr:MAG: RNA-binding protein [Oscillatoriales cyanobacterium CG2_30_40_61]HBW58403.1 RNA-binding protein [Oscillatoriales bacterium UBA8482]
MNNSDIQQGQEWLEKLLKLGAVPSQVKPSLEADSCWLTIDQVNLTPEQVATLIGQDGEVLDAIQYLLNAIHNLGKEDENRTSYTVELNGYRTKRHLELRALADHAASRVRETGGEVEIKSLSSPERRLIHSFLQESDDLETYSRGQEPDRRLVIKMKG